MEKFYLELPSIQRKIEAFDYINEFYEFGSEIHGTGSLDRELKKEIVLLFKKNNITIPYKQVVVHNGKRV